MSNSNKKYELLTGALLHDIGKIVRRSGSSNEKHEIAGGKFLKGLGVTNKTILDCVEKHHNPNRNDSYTKYIKNMNNTYVLITILSDHLSSSEREEDEENSEDMLVNIFRNIFNNKSKNCEIDKNYSEKFTFGQIPTAEDYRLIKNHFKLIKKLNLNNVNPEKFEKLFYFYMKNTMFIPSAVYKNIPDVSLWDHSKTTCAIACCLYNLYEKGIINQEDLKETINKKGKLNKNWFSLIHGDISGIQKFIFDIKTKGALKQLKARSFLLDFITEVYARYVVDILNLSIANILFVGGGHFYILSYKIDEKDIEEISKKINECLFRTFGGKVSLNIGYVDISVSDFVDKNIPGKWSEVSTKTSKYKSMKFKNLEYEKLFEPKNEKLDRCEVCGNLSKSVKKFEGYDNKKACKLCRSLKNLAASIKEFYDEKEIDIKELEKNELIKGIVPKDCPLLNLFPCGKYVFDFEKMLVIKNDKIEEIKPILLYSLHVPMVKDKKDNENEQNGNKSDKRVIELSELAEKSEGSNKIGILKGDVDNLGLIFRNGLGNDASLSRMSVLSNMFSLFFKYYVPKYIEKEAKYKDNLYLVYSGGDDFLVVGPWDKVLEFAKDLNDKFKEFVCENENIHLSMGLVITDPKHSFKNAVLLADEYLDKAKDNDLREDNKREERTNPKYKNSLTILGVPFNWDYELRNDKKLEFGGSKIVKKDENDIKDIKKYVLSLYGSKDSKCFGELLCNIIEETNKKRLLHILRETSLRLDKAKENNWIDLKYYHRFIYYLNRNIKDEVFINELKKLLEKLLVDQNKKKKYLKLLAVCCKIAELKMR